MRISCIIFFICFTMSMWALDPVKEYIDHPMNSNMIVESIEIKTNDDYMLKSWICFPKKEDDKKRILVLAYGDNGNMSYWIRQVLEVVKQGYTVVLFDYRGFGESQDFDIDKKMLYYDEFTTDLKAVVDYTRDRFKQPVGVWAFSMGTINATLLYSQDKFDYMIADGFVGSPKRIVEIINEHLNEEYKLPNSAANYEDALSRLSLPILFFAGDRDGLTSPEDSYRAKYLNPKSDIVLYKGLHLQGFQALSLDYHGQRYVEAMNKFYDSLYPEGEK